MSAPAYGCSVGSEKHAIINGGIDYPDKRIHGCFKSHRALAPTFAAESGRKLRWSAYFTFVAAGIAGWLANTAALLVAVEVLLLPVWLAKLTAIMASFIVNFSFSNFVVFRVRRSLPATT